MSQPGKYEIADQYREIQEMICKRIAAADGGAEFGYDQWTRPEGGGGLSRILTEGRVLEKAGVNFSAVEGKLSKDMQQNLRTEGEEFFATGVSIVMHPKNPHVPIIHMNIRYFELDNGVYWFGGGIDLTPHYVVKEDAKNFHLALKNVCDKHDTAYYDRFKKWADDYFYIPHREETRGIGGIFYDHLMADETHSKEDIFKFSLDLGKLFPDVYSKLIGKHGNKSFSAEEKQWQLIRRGRYVEFNLVYDRGTKFGLQSNGRIESILMSLPKEANWFYAHQPPEGSREAETLELLKKDINWINIPV